MKRHQAHRYAIVFVAFVWFILLVINIKHYVPNSFFAISAANLLQIFIIVGLSFFLTDSKTDHRKKTDILEHIIEKSYNTFLELDQYTICVFDSIEGENGYDERTLQKNYRRKLSTHTKLLSYIESLKCKDTTNEFCMCLRDIEREIDAYEAQWDNVSMIPGHIIEQPVRDGFLRHYDLIDQKFTILQTLVHDGMFRKHFRVKSKQNNLEYPKTRNSGLCSALNQYIHRVYTHAF